jgi:hypothetical protein
MSRSTEEKMTNQPTETGCLLFDMGGVLEASFELHIDEGAIHESS